MAGLRNAVSLFFYNICNLCYSIGLSLYPICFQDKEITSYFDKFINSWHLEGIDLKLIRNINFKNIFNVITLGCVWLSETVFNNAFVSP